MAAALWAALVGPAHGATIEGMRAPPAPRVQAKAIVVMDRASGRILYASNPGAKRAIASTTKILTALVAREVGDLDRQVAVETTPTVWNGILGLAPGDSLTRRQLIYAMLLKSANDAAYVLAQDISGSQADFADRMNDLARRMKTGEVHMSNPHGLPDASHRGTARAVAIWSRALLADPVLAAMVRTKSHRLGRFGVVENTNLLLWRDRRVTGVKTGYTDAAGYCLSASAATSDGAVIAVVLGAPSDSVRFRGTESLLGWGLSLYRPRLLVSGGRDYARPEVAEWDDRRTRLVAARDASPTVLSVAPVEETVLAPSVAPVPMRRGEELGQVRLTQNGRLVATVPLVAAENVPRPDFWDRIGMLFRRLFGRPAPYATT